MTNITANETFGRFYRSIMDRGIIANASSPALRVYLVLLSHAEFESGRCYPSRGLLTELAGIGKDNCHSALKELRSYGLIKFKRTGKRFGFRNAYQIIFPPKIPDVLAFPIRKRCTRPVFTDKCTGRFVKSGDAEACVGPVNAVECVRPVEADKEQDRTIEQVLASVDDPSLEAALRSLSHTLSNNSGDVRSCLNPAPGKSGYARP